MVGYIRFANVLSFRLVPSFIPRTGKIWHRDEARFASLAIQNEHEKKYILGNFEHNFAGVFKYK